MSLSCLGRRLACLQDVQIPPAVTKWLRAVGVEEVQLRGLPWSKLAAPGGHGKGMWWLPQASEGLPGGDGFGDAASAGGTLQRLLADDAEDNAGLLRAAAEQVSGARP